MISQSGFIPDIFIHHTVQMRVKVLKLVITYFVPLNTTGENIVKHQTISRCFISSLNYNLVKVEENLKKL